MAKIKNKQMNLLKEDGSKIDYAFLISILVNVPTKEGVTVKEMKRDISILTKFEKVEVDAEVEVNEEELARIASIAEKHKWPQVHVDLIEFVDYLTELK